MLKLQFEPKITIGNVVMALVFIASAAMWTATIGADVDQIKTEAATTRLIVKELELRMAATEQELAIKLAVNEEQAKWIINSLAALQRDRGIRPAPTPNVGNDG